MEAVEDGFRLRVPGTYLWFNVEGSAWVRIRAALRNLGAEVAQGGLDGEELCSAVGLTVSYHAQNERMQAEVGVEGGEAAAACLSALLEVAPRPAAEASPMWLWSPQAFAVAGQDARPAERLLRAARWRSPRAQARAVLDALAAALADLDERANVQLEVQAECALSVSTPLVVEDRADRDRRSTGFTALVSRLGEPVRADHVTWADAARAAGDPWEGGRWRAAKQVTPRASERGRP